MAGHRFQSWVRRQCGRMVLQAPLVGASSQTVAAQKGPVWATAHAAAMSLKSGASMPKACVASGQGSGQSSTARQVPASDRSLPTRGLLTSRQLAQIPDTIGGRSTRGASSSLRPALSPGIAGHRPPFGLVGHDAGAMGFGGVLRSTDVPSLFIEVYRGRLWKRAEDDDVFVRTPMKLLSWPPGPFTLGTVLALSRCSRGPGC